MPCIKPARRALAALVLSAITLTSPAAWAQQASDSGEALPQTVIDGFRSAKFGMNETDVRQAIAIDFHVDSDQIKRAEDPVNRTTTLEAIVPEVLPSGGKSSVDYVFGYRSHELISVSVIWSGKIDPTVTDSVLNSNGATLQSYFRGAGYKADTIKMNVFVPQLGYVLFLGRDVEGHATQLILGGNLDQSQPTHLKLTPTILTLSYIADPEKPDIFRIAPGQF